MVRKCDQCKKIVTKADKRKLVGETGICVECTETNSKNANGMNEDDHEDDVVNPDAMLSELSVRDFTSWFKSQLDDVIVSKVADATKNITKELSSTKGSLKTAQQEIKDLKQTVESLKTSLKEAKEERDQLKSTSKNNLKYLINHDRNVRRNNVMVFGLPEKDNLVVGQIEATNDEAKIQALLSHMKIREKVETTSLFRLGKLPEVGNEDADDACRPIKLVLKNSAMSSLITENAKLLKTLNLKIFIKPDKSKKEREEFQRLLKKKEELMIKHPTEEGGIERVVLKKGVLTVDGAEVDKYNTPQTIF